MNSRVGSTGARTETEQPLDLRDVDFDVVRSGVRLMALRQLGSADLADEVAQEAVVRALAAIEEGRLGDMDRLGAFVRGIARHVIVDVLRERARGRAADLHAAPASADPDPLTLIVTAEERARVRTALDGLSPEDRELLRLCYWDGLSPGELASRLGEPSPRIRKRKSRAVARLREAFLDLAARSRSEPTPDLNGELGSVETEGAG